MYWAPGLCLWSHLIVSQSTLTGYAVLANSCWFAALAHHVVQLNLLCACKLCLQTHTRLVQCRQLEVVEGPLVDLEVRGVLAVQYFGNEV